MPPPSELIFSQALSRSFSFNLLSIYLGSINEEPTVRSSEEDKHISLWLLMFWCFWSKECLGEWEDVVVISAQELEWENTGSSSYSATCFITLGI